MSTPEGPTDDVPPTWTITASFHPGSVDEGQFVWIVKRLDGWATESAELTFVAAPRRLSAFYDSSGFVPFPQV